MVRAHTRDGPRHTGGRPATSGQAMVETIIALTIVMLIVMGLIHLSMLAATRHVLNFAAFSAARASVYGAAGDQQRSNSLVQTIIRVLPRGTQLAQAFPQGGNYRVVAWSPFAYPFSGTTGRTLVTSQAPMYSQPTIEEAGDNASR